MRDFVFITNKNWKEIAEQLNKRGVLVEYGKGWYGGDATLSFAAEITSDTIYFDWDRETHEFKRHPRSRHYSIRQERCVQEETEEAKIHRRFLESWGVHVGPSKEILEFCSSLFERLFLTDNYYFQINPGFEHSICGGCKVGEDYWQGEKRFLYSPNSEIEKIEPSLRFVFSEILGMSKLDKGLVEKIIPYVTEDLRTGNIAGHNQKAGMEADVMCGLA